MKYVKVQIMSDQKNKLLNEIIDALVEENKFLADKELETYEKDGNTEEANDKVRITRKLAYGDNFVKYDGTIYERKDINGKDMIIVDGVAKEAGDHDFPWENDANNGK